MSRGPRGSPKIVRYEDGTAECIVNQTKYVQLPQNKRPVLRWIVSVKSNGRIIARTPKKNIGVSRLWELHIEDYSEEKLLPVGTEFWKHDPMPKRCKNIITKS